MTKLMGEHLTDYGWAIVPDWVWEGMEEPKATAPNGSILTIQREVCEKYGVTLDEMLGARRTYHIARPRMIAMARCVDELTHLSLPQIGRAFGYRDHTTVMHAHRKYGCQKARESV